MAGDNVRAERRCPRGKTGPVRSGTRHLPRRSVALTVTVTEDPAPNSDRGGRRHLAAGVVASVCALLSTPVIDAVRPLHFVRGAIISVTVPGAFGLVALMSGVRLYRRQETRRGVGLVVGGVLTALIGVLYGLTSVF